MTRTTTIGIVGARGYVGAELIRLVAAHPGFELAFVSSRELDGQRVADHVDGYARRPALRRLRPRPGRRRRASTRVVLALPNGKAAPFVAAFDAAAPDTVIIDLSADYRFDDGWYYGLPELTRARYAGQRRISNPGCYATAMQLAIAPMLRCAGRPGAVLRRVRLFRRRHHALGQERSGQAARQPDAVRADRPRARARGHAPARPCRSSSCRMSRRISAASPSPPTCTCAQPLQRDEVRRALPRALRRRAAGARASTKRRGSARIAGATTSSSAASRCPTTAAALVVVATRTTCSRARRRRRCRTSTSRSASTNSPASRTARAGAA